MDTPVYVIDTHTLVWYIEDSPGLSSTARGAFVEIEKGLALGVVPTIVLAELIHLADRNKIPTDPAEVIARLSRSSSFRIVSLDLLVVLLMVPLKNYEIHDRVIVAIAKSFEASLVTKDEHIQKSGAVPCVW